MRPPGKFSLQLVGRGVMTGFRSGLVALTAAILLPIAAPAADGPVDYLRDVKPILAKNCYQCHGAKAQKGGLRLDTVASLNEGGDTGPAITPGQSGASLLIKAVTGAEGVTRMPLKKPALPAEHITLLKAWIDAGAAAPAREQPDDGKQGQTHWSFIPPTRSPVPAIRNPQSAIRNPIDSFVLVKLQAAGLKSSRPADRATLIRRVTLD